MNFILENKIEDFFEYKKIKDIFKISNGKSQKKVESSSGLYPIYGTGGVMGYSKEKLNDGNSFIIGRKGTIDNPIFIKEPYWSIDTAFNTKDFKINPFYCFLLFKKIDILKYKSGGVLPSLTQKDLNEIELLVPKEVDYCNKVVEIYNQQQKLIDLYKEKLSILEQQESHYQDELLSGRLRIRLTKESMDYAIQQGWVEDGDVVNGKEEGFESWLSEDFENKVEFYENQDWCLFDENHKKKEYPVDFSKKKVKDFFNCRMGKTILKKNVKEKGKIPVYSATEEDKYFGYIEESDLVLKRGDLVISARGSIGFIKFVREKVTATQTNIVAEKKKIDSYYVMKKLMWLKNKKEIFYFSGGAIPQLTVKDFNDYDLIIPSDLEMAFFSIFTKKISCFKNLIEEKIKVEEEKMEYLMDELLSGRIRIEE
jgi:hypothetical protein